MKVDFGEVIKHLKAGGAAARLGWNGAGQYVKLHKQHDMLPYIVLRTVDGNRVPWTPSQSDMLCQDWILVENE